MTKKIPGWLWVAALFLACALGYGLLCSYPRELAVYSDELRYLDIARSLFAGQGLVVRGLPSDYQKILYPLCLLPALLAKGTAAQITAIGWLNAAWMASAVFPVYALARHTGQNGRRTAFLLGAAALLPTWAASATFMSETVFYPLSLWMVYLLLRCMDAADPARRAAWCAAAGVWCYLLYLNKEVALYYPLAYLATRAWWLFYHRDAWRGEVVSWAALAAGFGLCFAAGKLTLFAGLGNSYNQTGWLSAEQWGYLPFAVLCDVLFFVLAFGVLPVLLPLCALRRPAGDKKAGREKAPSLHSQLSLLLLLCLLIGAAAVAYTITVREDLGLPDPRIHTRYVEPLLLPLLLVSLNALDAAWSKTRRRLLAALTALWGLGFVALCRTIGQGAGDNTFLQWYDFVTDRIDRLPGLSTAAWLLIWRLAVVLTVAALTFIVLHSVNDGPLRKKALPGLAVFTLALCLACNAGEQRINRWAYEIAPEQAAAASNLNDSLKDLDGNILFVAAAVRGRDSQLIDTYIDTPVYLAEYPQLAAAGLLEDGVLDLSRESVTPEYPGKPYPDLKRADWILASDDVPLDQTTLLPANQITPQGYTLYRNETPMQVQFLQ